MVLEFTLPGMPPIQYITHLSPVMALIGICTSPGYWWGSVVKAERA